MKPSWRLYLGLVGWVLMAVTSVALAWIPHHIFWSFTVIPVYIFQQTFLYLEAARFGKGRYPAKHTCWRRWAPLYCVAAQIMLYPILIWVDPAIEFIGSIWWLAASSALLNHLYLRHIYEIGVTSDQVKAVFFAFVEQSRSQSERVLVSGSPPGSRYRM